MIYTFGDCELHTATYSLRRDGQTLHLRPKVFQVLTYLLEHGDRVVGKDELCDAVWPNQAMSDAALETTIRAVRRAVGDTGRDQRIIKTLTGYGYRLVLPVTIAEASPEPPDLQVELSEASASSDSLSHHQPEQSPPPVAALSVEEVSAVSAPPAQTVLAGTRRQLTVLCCDVRDVTSLSGSPLDPEDLPAILHTVDEVYAPIIGRYGGTLVSGTGEVRWAAFGYPQAYEDAAPRAVRAALELVDAVQGLQPRLTQDWGVRLCVRVGLHTGLVVVPPAPDGQALAPLVGETPTVAERLVSLAPADSVVLSGVTARLVEGRFVWEDQGVHTLAGVSAPVAIVRMLRASDETHRLEEFSSRPVSPLVGRDAELALLMSRWTQVQSGWGQVALVSGEPGIGKSRFVQALRERMSQAGSRSIVFRCSPYATQSSLYPIIVHMQRLLQWQRGESPAETFDKLERLLQAYDLPLEDIMPLLAVLLALPTDRYPPLQMSPQRQKQRTYDALIACLLAEAERQPVLGVFEDMHWADPSTLELLGLFFERVQTVPILTLLTYRPEFRPPWAIRSPFTQLVLPRLDPAQMTTMMAGIMQGKALPAEVVQHVIDTTEGVPLFVEEYAKMVVESGWLQEAEDRYVMIGVLPSHAIPATLHDTLMARLERLTPGVEVARIGAICGREFPAELLRAVAPLKAEVVERGLAQLVEAELLFHVGLASHQRYRFKHALVQEAAYQSLLRRTRQHLHQRIAQVLETQFPETVETQPELVAHHYTAAGLHEQALVYWQRAGERAVERSAVMEVVAHLTQGLEGLNTLPETPERLRHELTLRVTLGAALVATKGYGAPDVVQTYSRAWELCQQVGETPDLCPVLWGLWAFYDGRGEFQQARELGEQLLALAQQDNDPASLLAAHSTLGCTSYFLGTFVTARTHLEQGMTLYDLQLHYTLIQQYVEDPGVTCRGIAARTLWMLGYPDQAQKHLENMLTLVHELAHPYTTVFALVSATFLHQFCRDEHATHERAKVLMGLATEQEFQHWLALGTILQGWALAVQGQEAEGLSRIHQGLAAWRATGSEHDVPYFLGLLAETYGQAGQAEKGLRVVDDALTLVNKHDERFWEAELYRLQGELLLQATGDRRQVEWTPEACFHHALEIARSQQAKALELRTAMSLGRLWQQQGKQQEARELVAEVYGWFTEGFDTADLQEARALLEELG